MSLAVSIADLYFASHPYCVKEYYEPENSAKMKMNFNTELPLGKMLFVGWDVETRPDLA